MNDSQMEAMSVAVFLRRGNKIALCQRIDPNRSYYQKWALAGGGVEENELFNPILAVQREVEEETGLWISQDDISYLGLRKNEGTTLYCLYFVAWVPDNEEAKN